MEVGIDVHFGLDERLHSRRQRIPRLHANRQVHQIDRLVQRHETGRSHGDVVGDLMETERVVDGGTDVIGHVDGAAFQGGEDFTTRQQRRLGSGRLEHLRHHAARQAHLASPEVFDRTDRHFGMDDVRPVVNGADVVHVEFGEQIAGNLQTAEAIEENIPFVRIAQAQGIGTEEHRRRHTARPVQRKRVHRLDNAVLDRVEQLEVANDFGRAERSESQFAAGLVGDAVGPGLEISTPTPPGHEV